MTNPRDLVQLRALYQNGLLTEDEYTEARRRLLGYKVKRGRAVPPAPPASQSDSRRSLNAQTNEPLPHNPNNDLPLLFALGALALVAIAATVWFLMG